MSDWLKTIIIPAIVSALVSGLTTFFASDFVDVRSKARGAQVDQILKFTSADEEFVSTANEYIKIIANKGDVSEIQGKLKLEAVKQIKQTETLKSLFPDKAIESEILKYQGALTRFSENVKDATDATKMRGWAENFGAVLDSKRSLTSRLMKFAKVT